MLVTFLGIGLIVLLAAVVVYLRLLTPVAGLSGAGIASLAWLELGMGVVLCLALFFVSGAGVTRLKKPDLPTNTGTGPRADRKASQVWANGGVVALSAVLAGIFPANQSFWAFLAAAALSSAIADTLSSELGTRYGRRFVNVLHFKPDQRGADGVISLEGCLFGLAGSLLLAIVYKQTGLPFSGTWKLVVAGTAGNFADSYLGAVFQRNGYLDNDWVNFFNTLVAALLAAVLWSA